MAATRVEARLQSAWPQSDCAAGAVGRRPERRGALRARAVPRGGTPLALHVRHRGVEPVRRGAASGRQARRARRRAILQRHSRRVRAREPACAARRRGRAPLRAGSSLAAPGAHKGVRGGARERSLRRLARRHPLRRARARRQRPRGRAPGRRTTHCCLAGLFHIFTYYY